MRHLALTWVHQLWSRPNDSIGRNTHIQATQGACNAGLVGEPVRENESLKAKFVFENSIDKHAVLTDGGFVYLSSKSVTKDENALIIM